MNVDVERANELFFLSVWTSKIRGGGCGVGKATEVVFDCKNKRLFAGISPQSVLTWKHEEEEERKASEWTVEGKEKFFHLILFRESLKFVLIMSGSYNFFKRKKKIPQLFSPFFFRHPPTPFPSTPFSTTHNLINSNHNFHSQIWLIIKI